MWAERLRAARRAKLLSQKELAKQLTENADEHLRPRLPTRESLIRKIKGWEAGDHRPADPYRELLRRALDINIDAVLDQPQHVEARQAVQDVPEGEGWEFLELARLAETSDLGGGTLENLEVIVDRLCRDYPHVHARELRDRAKGQIRYVLRLLAGRTTLVQHRELLVRAGWLSLLLGCVYYDLGDTGPAEAARRTALRLGHQAGHGEIVVWSWEMAAWFALVEGRYPDVVAASHAGREQGSGVGSAAVQLVLQEAKGYARMGDNRAEEALESGRRLLSRLPIPDHPEHHFVFDRSKYEFYAATIYTWLGNRDDAADEHAREVVDQCSTPTGIRWPMRLADARIDLGVLAGRRGDLDEAVGMGRAAFDFDRRSASLISRSQDLYRDLATRYPGEQLIQDYQELLVHEQIALTEWPRHRITSKSRDPGDDTVSAEWSGCC